MTQSQTDLRNGPDANGLFGAFFTATQYAFLSSLMAASRYLVSAPTGFLVAAVGWTWFYVLCGLAALPALLSFFAFPPGRLS